MFGPWQIVIILVLVVLLFGRGKISELMGDVAKGITSFRKGLAEGNAENTTPTNEANKPGVDETQSGTVIDNETGKPVEKDGVAKD